MRIRNLRADEIEVRVQSVKEKGFILLLYKDARADMAILDETFGALGWQRRHEVIAGNLFCTISIWDSEKQQWVEKQDVGVESNTQKEKGQASDAFKRAAVNIGIGRELYTAPFIWVTALKDEIKQGKQNNLQVFTKFKVKEIEYNENREISKLVIVDDKGIQRFPNNYQQDKSTKAPPIERNAMQDALSQTRVKHDIATPPIQTLDPNGTITEEKQKLLFSTARKDENLVKFVISNKGYEATKDILNKDFQSILTEIVDMVKQNLPK